MTPSKGHRVYRKGELPRHGCPCDPLATLAILGLNGTIAMANDTTNVELSVVIPCYNEAASCDLLFEELLPALEDVTSSFEVVCVDDGSTDATAGVIEAWAKRDSRVKLVSFTRNFGKEAALTAGIQFTRGRAVVPFDADLQDPPRLIGEMVALWRAGAPLVLARRTDRTSDTLLKRTTSNLFYIVFSRLAHPALPRGIGDFRLMDRMVVDALCQLPERSRFMKGMFAWVGYDAVVVDYTRLPRRAGTTKFNYLRLWNFALDGIFSFSSLPLKVWSYVGFLVSFMAFSYMGLVLVQKLAFGIDVPGYASIVTLTLFLNGVVLVSLGVIGEYIARIFVEVKQRPHYLVHHTVGIATEAGAPSKSTRITRLAS